MNFSICSVPLRGLQNTHTHTHTHTLTLSLSFNMQALQTTRKKKKKLQCLQDLSSPRAKLHMVGMLLAVYVFDINQPNLPPPSYSVLVSISVFVVLSTVLYPINSPYNSPLSHSVLPVLFLPYWAFQPYISL